MTRKVRIKRSEFEASAPHITIWENGNKKKASREFVNGLLKNELGTLVDDVVHIRALDIEQEVWNKLAIAGGFDKFMSAVDLVVNVEKVYE